MSDKVTVANIPLVDYDVRSTIATDGSNIQHVRLDVGSGTDEALVTDALGLPVSSAPKTAAFDDDGTYTYIGLAAPGALTSAAVWRIIRMTNADDRMIYADGNSNYDNMWDDHLILSYS